MLLSIASFLLLVGTFYLFFMCMTNKELKEKFPAKLAVSMMLIFILGIFRPFAIVDAGHVGIVKTWGNVTSIKNSGLTLLVPFAQSIEEVTTRPIQIDQKIEVGPTGAITRDNQTVGARMTYFYKYKSDKMKSIYCDLGLERLANIITNSGIECFKQEIGNHAIFDIPINQSKIQSTVIASLRAKMSEYPIEITDLKIVNYDWSDEFDKQIQETMHRAQQVKQKEQELLIAEQEAQKKVKQATADKEALITQAEGEKAAALLRADAKAAEGEGIRKYNQYVQANMELELKIRQLEIEKIKAQQWNGQYVPTNNYGPIPVQTGSLQPSK